jgi:hypothetical protein
MAGTVRWEDEGLWTQRQARTIGVLAGLGLVGLGLCWFFLSGEAAYQDQVPWLIGAIGFVALIGVVLGYWLLIGVRLVHAGSREVASVLRVHTLDPRRRLRAVAASRSVDAGFVATPAMTRAHRDGCLLVRGKPVTALSAADVSARGLQLCGACNR